MAPGSTYGPMAACTRESGGEARPAAKEGSRGPPAPPTRETSSPVGSMASALSLESTATCTADHGSPTESTASVRNATATETCTKGGGSATCRTGREGTCGGTEMSISESGRTVSFREKVFWFGRMGTATKGFGKKECPKGRVCSLGAMEAEEAVPVTGGRSLSMKKGRRACAVRSMVAEGASVFPGFAFGSLMVKLVTLPVTLLIMPKLLCFTGTAASPRMVERVVAAGFLLRRVLVGLLMVISRNQVKLCPRGTRTMI
uniref:Phosphatidyl inositol phosphate kinase n=1 Tax=Arachis hypogaea TaxID=3818 RepID=A0A0U3E0B1_ARAHY|nr:phosphatidyl inositol phosphate kinase [Arachis hypogaea]